MPIIDVKGVKVKNKSSIPVSMLFKMLPSMPHISFYAKQSVEEYSKRFKSPLLQLLFQNIIGSDFAASGMVLTLATLASGDGGYPEGGSLGMAVRMAKYFEKLGGTVKYGCKVDKVLVQDGIARGIIVNGSQVQSDSVIVTEDTLVAIDKLFDSPIHEQWAENMRKNTKPILDTFICTGIKADLSHLPERLEFIPDKPLMCGGVSQPVIGICNYAGYTGYAPQGCSTVTSIIMGNSYNYWKSCKENGTYYNEKQKLAEAFIDILAKKYPETAGKVEVWDVATPLTYERYLGSYKGSWMSKMNKGESYTSYPVKPENIQNVYFASQRLKSPGGLPTAVTSGRNAVQYLCKDTNTVFQSNI